jgi:hypothetical protein
MRCRTCGDDFDGEVGEFGGRRRHYCGPRCRQRGYRLRGKLGADWWRQQPWRVEADRQEAERQRLAQEAKQQREAALQLMSPEERKRIKDAEYKAWIANLTAANRRTQRLERRIRLTKQLLTEEQLKATLEGRVVRFGNPCDDEQIELLLNKAIVTDTPAEASAFFDKARRIWHKQSPSSGAGDS